MKTSSWLGLGLITTWASLSLIPLSADPEWWSDGNPPVIEPGAPENHRGPANIGQAKWMVSEALRALGEVDPVAAGQIEDRLTQAQPHPTQPNLTLPPILSLELPPPAERNQAWKDKQRAPLLIGQLKAMSAPFYEVLHTRHPAWLAAQRTANQTQDSANLQNIYPWTATPTDDENRAIANIGQLKAVFALSFEDIEEGPLDSDGDGLPDEWEIAHGLDPNTSGDQNNSFQGGATTNGQAFESGVQANPQASLTDLDGDGINNTEDAGPEDREIDWRPTVAPKFAVIDIDAGNVEPLILNDFSDDGTILLTDHTQFPYERVFVDQWQNVHRFPSWTGWGGTEFTSYAPTLIGNSVPGQRAENGISVFYLVSSSSSGNLIFEEWIEPANYLDSIKDHRDGLMVANSLKVGDGSLGDGLAIDPPGVLLPSEDAMPSGAARIESNRNILSNLKYWRWDPINNEYEDAVFFSELTQGFVRSATLTQVNRDPAGQAVEVVWNLVASTEGILVSKDSGPFVSSSGSLKGTSCSGVTSQGWVADLQNDRLWSNGKWESLVSILGSDWAQADLLDISDTGVAVAKVKPSAGGGPWKLALLLPVEIAVDADRNGEIEFGTDTTSEATQFRFWVNNDQDDVEVDEPSEVETPDSDDEAIATKRDLEDFARIRLSVGLPLNNLRDGDWKVGLGFKAGSGQTPAIRVWPNESETGEDSYLDEHPAAERQIAEQSFGATSGGTVFLPASYWQDRDDTEAHLIFEGITKGTGKLALILQKGSEGPQIEGPVVHLKLLDVREMFQRARIANEGDEIPNPWIDDTPPAQSWVWDEWNWAYDEDPEAEDTTAIFVHGWRLTYYEYLNWAQTSYKRLWHQGFKGKFYTFRWATLSGDQSSFEGYLSYNPSEYRSWLCGPALASWVNSLADFADQRRIFAHSMGNVICGAALRAGMEVESYALCNAAMASMAYDSHGHMRLDPTTGQPWDKIWGNLGPQKTPDTDPTATIRNSFGLEGKFNGGSNFPQMINFYLHEDEALDLWVDNNRHFKPDSIGHSYYYQETPVPPNLTYKLFQAPPAGHPREVISPPEAFGYVTKALTRTAGSDSRTGGSIGSSVNMNDWGVGARHWGFGVTHSAQWRWSNQSTSHFWDKLCAELQLTEQ